MAFSLHVYVKYGSLLRYYSCSRVRNPYEVLGLKQTCSQKDVKNAYIKLCKELHPDAKPGDASQHKKFIELNDAYTALISTENKKQNAENVAHNEPDFSHYTHRTYSYQKEWTEKSWYDSEEYQEYIRRRDMKHDKNYKNTKANLLVVTGCFIIMVVGSVLYLSAYRYASEYKKDTVDKKSKKISENYEDVRRNALEKGRIEQLYNLQKKWSS